MHVALIHGLRICSYTLMSSIILDFDIIVRITVAGALVTNLLVIYIAANAMQMQSPIAYEERNSDPNAPKHGMNFAVGGSGVFNPYGMLNLRGQINQFESFAKTVYPKEFLQYSVVLVGIHGNDYAAYLRKGNPISVSFS